MEEYLNTNQETVGFDSPISHFMNTIENTIVKKWKPLLEFESGLIKPIPEDKWDYVAGILESYELLFKNYPKFLKQFIPQVRALEGEVTYRFEMIKGKICVVVIGGNFDGIKTDIGLPLEPESDLSNGMIMKYYYIMINGKWTFI